MSHSLLITNAHLVNEGRIDDQVHFREPGVTHKGDIASESRAALAGGITSFMDMPYTRPQTITGQTLKDKFALAQGRAWGNHAFYFGATNTTSRRFADWGRIRLAASRYLWVPRPATCWSMIPRYSSGSSAMLRP